MWAYNNAFVDWCISTYHILLLDFSFSYTSLSFGFFLFDWPYHWNDNPIRRILLLRLMVFILHRHSHWMLSMHFSLRQSNWINQSTERNVMSSSGKSLTSTSPMCILDQGRTIPAPVDYEGILKMEGTRGLHGRHLPISNSAKTSSLSRSLSRC